MASADADMAAISRSEFDDNLARARAGAEQLAAQLARNQAGRERVAIDEPAIHAGADAANWPAGGLRLGAGDGFGDGACVSVLPAAVLDDAFDAPAVLRAPHVVGVGAAQQVELAVG
jgi:hypothetical protein